MSSSACIAILVLPFVDELDTLDFLQNLRSADRELENVLRNIELGTTISRRLPLRLRFLQPLMPKLHEQWQMSQIEPLHHIHCVLCDLTTRHILLLLRF